MFKGIKVFLADWFNVINLNRFWLFNFPRNTLILKIYIFTIIRLNAGKYVVMDSFLTCSRLVINLQFSVAAGNHISPWRCCKGVGLNPGHGNWIIHLLKGDIPSLQLFSLNLNEGCFYVFIEDTCSSLMRHIDKQTDKLNIASHN